MPVSKEKADLKNRFRDNPEGIARHLSESLAKNELGPVLKALNEILVGQNVMAVAREAGMRRDKLYRTFGGRVDPTLGRVLALLDRLPPLYFLAALPRRRADQLAVKIRLLGWSRLRGVLALHDDQLGGANQNIEWPRGCAARVQSNKSPRARRGEVKMVMLV
jgi:DNA-binding phage protein